MSFNPSSTNEHSDLEEILDLQRQGRRLSDMQMRSLNSYVQRRFSRPTQNMEMDNVNVNASAMMNRTAMNMNVNMNANGHGPAPGHGPALLTSNVNVNVPNSPLRSHSNFHDQYQNHQQGHGGNVNVNVNGMGVYSSAVNNHGAPAYDHPAMGYSNQTHTHTSDLNIYNQINQLNSQGLRDAGGNRSGTATGFRGSNAGFNAGGARRRSSMMINNFLNEMGYEGGERGMSAQPPQVTQSTIPHHNLSPSPERRRMEKRNSLDLLGDAAVAVEQQQNRDAAAAAAASKRDSLSSLVSGMNNMNSGMSMPIKRMSMDMAMNDHSHVQAQAHAHAQAQAHAHAPYAAQAQRLNSIDLLVSGGEPTFQSRRNSLSHLLASDFLSPSRRASLAAGISARGADTKPMDPYLDNLFEENRMSAGLAGLNPSNQNSMLALQLLQQEAQEAEEASALSSVEEYIKLQKLQTALRRQSLSNVVGELSLMQELQNQPTSLSLQKQAELEETEQQLQYQLQGQLQMEQIQNMMHGSKNNSNHSSSNPMMTQSDISPQKQSKRHSNFEEELNLSEPIMPSSIGSDAIESFRSTMDKSQKSQQDIQSWDKKMGLKRSHSATMTKTTRSRKQLRRLFEMHMQRLQVKAQLTKGNGNINVSADQEGMNTILGINQGQSHRFSM